MKIGFLYDMPYPWHKGGIEQLMMNEAAELAKSNEVHFLTLRWPGMEKEFVHNGIHYHAYARMDEKTAYRGGRRSIKEASIFAMSAINLFRFKFDAVITDAFPFLHLPTVRLYCRMNGCKLVINIAEVWRREYWKKYMGKIKGEAAHRYSGFAMKPESKYVAISSSTAALLQKRGIPRGNIRIFSPVIDDRLIGRIRRESGERKERRIIFSSRFIKEKRVDKWLEIFAEAHKKDPSVKGLLIGEGVEEASIRRDIKRLGLGKALIIRHFYSKKEDLYREIARSAAMLHMSEREGLGIVAIESVALGTPVVLPNYNEMPKEVREMCVVADEKKLADKILEIINSSNKEKYIKNTANLGLFSISKTREVYGRLIR